MSLRSRLIRIFGAIAVVTASFFASLWTMDYLASPCRQGEAIALNRPFQKLNGLAFAASVPALSGIADSAEAPTRSPILLCEDNEMLGPPHSLIADVAAKGKGRFVHWGAALDFSSSDKTDPNNNSRDYWAIRPR